MGCGNRVTQELILSTAAHNGVSDASDSVQVCRPRSLGSQDSSKHSGRSPERTMKEYPRLSRRSHAEPRTRQVPWERGDLLI